mgnify:CR=1 FL=1
MSKNQKLKKKQLRNYARFTSLSVQMGLIIFAGSYLGKYLDSLSLNNTPFYTIVFAVLSILFSIYYVLKELIKMNDKK